MALIAFLVLMLSSVTLQAETIDPITMDEIQREMAKGSPYEIIKDCDGMVFINYDKQGVWKQKYFKEVFQEGGTDKKPVLVLFYDIDREGVAYNLRGSIIFKELNKKYNYKLKFLAINLPWKEKNSEYHKMTLDAKSYHGKGLGIFSTS